MTDRGRAWALFALLGLAGCAGQPYVDGPPAAGSAPSSQLPPDPIPQAEERSRYGNGPIYEVYGQRYRVMDSSYGYEAQGIASWYGQKFHGRLTASREPYDMHAMTAAHRSLPLPTYVEVRNLANDKTVIVRVNDRGPFVDNRIIDLSYSAARRLDMVKNGTTRVEIRAISFDEPPRIASAIVPSASVTRPSTGIRGAGPRATVAKAAPEPQTARPRMYVQVGAFGDPGNAARRHRMLTDNGIDRAFVHQDADRTPPLYRVRIGPLDDVDHYDRMVEALSAMGIADTHLVTE